MPSIMVPLSQEESDRLRDRAMDELRHPRDTARLLIRQALGLRTRTALTHRKRQPHPPYTTGGGACPGLTPLCSCRCPGAAWSALWKRLLQPVPDASPEPEPGEQPNDETAAEDAESSA